MTLGLISDIHGNLTALDPGRLGEMACKWPVGGHVGISVHRRKPAAWGRELGTELHSFGGGLHPVGDLAHDEDRVMQRPAAGEVDATGVLDCQAAAPSAPSH